jgi:hypothetical protein
MRFLLNAAAGFAFAAWILGTGPFAGPPNPHWDVVKADLAAARPQARLAAQAESLFPAGLPRPAHDEIQEH